MVDLMSGPGYPRAKGFVVAGWRILAVDWVFGKKHDLAKIENQVAIREQLKQSWAAPDCSDKLRIREIPRQHASGEAMPSPLGSEELPMGLPGLQGRGKERVAASNAAAEFILGELRSHQSRGGASGREDPANSLHWLTPTERGMSRRGTRWDEYYDAWSLQGARKKKQCGCHDVEEIQLWPDMRGRHRHHPQEWTPQVSEDSRTWYQSKEEAEYTACLVFHIVYSVSVWACQVGRAKPAVPRCPPAECTEDREGWLTIDARALRGWAMIPMILAVGSVIGQFAKKGASGIIPSRHRFERGREQGLAVDEVYVGHGHHSHKRRSFKRASPSVAGQEGIAEECPSWFADHVGSSRLASKVEELAGKELLSDKPEGMPCTADALIARVYHAWMNGSLNPRWEPTEPRERVTLTPNERSGKMPSQRATKTRSSQGITGSTREGSVRYPLPPLQSSRRLRTSRGETSSARLRK